ncbi:MAG: TetR/AcrR family transcriptional regulator [Romboutsia sp.]
MIDKVYSSKEVLVFEGFSKLMNDGVSLNNIRVSDIAKSAGIGKGTVYEYFKSKEEVIAKSIFYKMQSEFRNILEESNKAVGFKEKCYIGFYKIMELMSKQLAYFQILLTSKEIHEIFICINGGRDEIIEFRNYILTILEPTIEIGMEENIINKNLHKKYIQTTFISVCSGISTMVHFNGGEIKEEEIKLYQDMAYTMLIKALR